jgi:hypothetical protein
MHNLDRTFFAARLIAVAAFGAIAPAHAAPSVVASLTQPPGGMACAQAAEEAQVVFDFKEPRSDVKQLSVFVNGKGLREEAIAEEWPRVYVMEGLRQGRNKVEIYTTGADNKTEAHTLTVLVGEARSRNDREDVAIVDCVGGGRDRASDASRPAREVIAEASDDTEEVIEDVRPRVDEDVDEVDDVGYEDAPAYVYRPYPVFGFVSFFPAYYYPWPYYYGSYGYRSYPQYYYGGRSYGHAGYYYGGGRNHGGSPRGGGSYWRGRSAPQPNRAPTHAAPSHDRGGGHGGGGGRHGNH